MTLLRRVWVVLTAAIFLLTGCTAQRPSEPMLSESSSEGQTQQTSSASGEDASSETTSDLPKTPSAVTIPPSALSEIGQSTEIGEILSEFSLRAFLDGKLYGTQQDQLAVYDVSAETLELYDGQIYLPSYDSGEAVNWDGKFYMTGNYSDLDLHQATTMLDIDAGKQYLVQQYDFGDIFAISRYGSDALCLIYACQTFYDGDFGWDEAQLWWQDLEKKETVPWKSFADGSGAMAQGMDIFGEEIWLFETEGSEKDGTLACFIRGYDAQGQQIHSYRSVDMDAFGDIYHIESAAFRFYRIGEKSFLCDVGDGLLTVVLYLKEDTTASSTAPADLGDAATLRYLGTFGSQSGFYRLGKEEDTAIYLFDDLSGSWGRFVLEGEHVVRICMDPSNGAFAVQIQENEELKTILIPFEAVLSRVGDVR